MATRRTTSKIAVDVPITPNRDSTIEQTAAKLDSPIGSPFLPTTLEALLLAIYPATLVLGSLFSTLHPAARSATYNPTLQSYDPHDAPSYFAKKGNIFNVYFVKVGWFWITAAFFTLIFTHSSLGPAFRVKVTKRRIQAVLRYVCVTTAWLFVTQWFFGPGIVDRSFRWTGGKCQQIVSESDLAEKIEQGDVKDVFSHAACKAIGGQWRGGHDISGHVFLLILGSSMLWLELLPAVLKMEGLREKRRIRTADGLTRNAAMEIEPRREKNPGDDLGLGIRAALTVAGLSWWMLLMTAAYFHTWFEKVTGLLVAFGAIYAVYFLPRGVPAVRNVLGLPGV